MHGGKSTGPKTAEGRRRALDAMQLGNRAWRAAGSPGIERYHRSPRLTEMQRRFRDLYPLTRNAALAAAQAGYSTRSAQQIGSRLLRHPIIAAALRQHFGQRFNPGKPRKLSSRFLTRAAA
jgi:hypothetical protein